MSMTIDSAVKTALKEDIYNGKVVWHNDFWKDFTCFLSMNHPLLSLFCGHYYDPYTKCQRWWTFLFVNAAGFGLTGMVAYQIGLGLQDDDNSGADLWIQIWYIYFYDWYFGMIIVIIERIFIWSFRHGKYCFVVILSFFCFSLMMQVRLLIILLSEYYPDVSLTVVLLIICINHLTGMIVAWFIFDIAFLYYEFSSKWVDQTGSPPDKCQSIYWICNCARCSEMCFGSWISCLCIIYYILIIDCIRDCLLSIGRWFLGIINRMIEYGSDKKRNPCDPENIKNKREKKSSGDNHKDNCCCGIIDDCCGCKDEENCCKCMCCGCNLCCCCKCIWDILKCICNGIRCICQTVCNIGDCCCCAYFICCNACLCACRIGRCLFRANEGSFVAQKDYFNVTYKDYTSYVNTKQTKDLVVIDSSPAKTTAPATSSNKATKSRNVTENQVSQQQAQHVHSMVAMQAPMSPQSQQGMMQQQNMNVPQLAMGNSASAGSVSEQTPMQIVYAPSSPQSQPVSGQQMSPRVVYAQPSSPQMHAYASQSSQTMSGNNQVSPQITYVTAPAAQQGQQPMVLVPVVPVQYTHQ